MPSNIGRSKSEAFKYIKDIIWSRMQGCMEKLLSTGARIYSNRVYCPSSANILYGVH
jgi:hypothetical protein